jgi:hypothetical protein
MFETPRIRGAGFPVAASGLDALKISKDQEMEVIQYIKITNKVLKSDV